MSALAHRPCPVVLAAPSGTGKTSIARALVGDERFSFSVSVTTRGPRRAERDGVDYRFLSEEAFDELIAADALCEWAEVHGSRYGTPCSNFDAAEARGVHLVLDVDVQGARQIRSRVRDAVLIFVFPPSAGTLLERLTGRGTEDRDDVAERLRNAREELGALGAFDYVVVNDRLDDAVRQIREIVRSEGHRPGRAVALDDVVGDLQEEIDRLLAENFASGTGSTTA